MKERTVDSYTRPPVENFENTDVIRLGNRIIEILDIRNPAHRKRAAELYANGYVVPWLRTSFGLTADLFNKDAARTINRVKGQGEDIPRGNVISITKDQLPDFVDARRHVRIIRWILTHRPDFLIAPEGGNFWNMYPHQALAHVLPWLTKPQATMGKPTFIVNVHNDHYMSELFAEIQKQKKEKGKPAVFGIQGTSIQPHGVEQFFTKEDIDPHIFDDTNVALVILDASYVDEKRKIARYADSFSITDLTGTLVQNPDQAFSIIRKSTYPISPPMQHILRWQKRIEFFKKKLQLRRRKTMIV